MFTAACHSHAPLDSGTTARRTSAVVPIPSEVNRLELSSRGSPIHRPHPGRRIPPAPRPAPARISPLIVCRHRALMDMRLTALRKEKRLETAMQMQKEIEALSRMPVSQLRQKYLEVFGEESRSNHKQFLFRRIARRLRTTPTSASGRLGPCSGRILR